jgi:cell division protein ZapA
MLIAVSARNVHLRVGGQSYRVSASGTVEELERLAAMVEVKLREVAPDGRPVTPQAMLLAAMLLAHEVETERERASAASARARAALRDAVKRIDALVGTLAEAEPAVAAGSFPEA